MRGSGPYLDWTARARAVPIETEIERRGVMLRREGLERVGACPKCGGEDRFAINIKKQVFNCRGCGIGGDVIQLVEHLDGVDFNAACTALTGQPPPRANGKGNGRDTSKKTVVATFEYQDQDGSVAFAVDRVQFLKPDDSFVLKDGKPDKVFRQRRPDPGHPGKWLPNVTGVPAVPYRLPEVCEAIANDHPVLVVEGEAKADLLWSWNVAATCCAGGAGKWKAAHSEFLRGADVVLVPDADDSGAKHIQQVGAALNGIARRVRVLMLPNLPPKGDIIDWVKAGGTREQLDVLMAGVPEWQPLKTRTPDIKTPDLGKGKAREDALLDALGKAQGLDYARQRKAAADELGVTKQEIDNEVKARREKAPLYGHWIVEPWPETIEGDALLRDIIRRIRRHVFCSHEDALAVALWVMLSWVHDVATHSPLLVMTSAEPMSGKTTMLGVLSFLVPRSIRSVEITEAALYRSLEL